MRALGALTLFLAIGCRPDAVDGIARSYLRLLPSVEAGGVSLERTRALLDELRRLPPTPRGRNLERQLEALVARFEILEGRELDFDEESRLLYGVVAPAPSLSEARRIREELDALLRGDGDLRVRHHRFQERFRVPPERLSAVLVRAIEECRRRTLEHLELPVGEAVRVEYVSGKAWPSFSTYRGDFQSVVEVSRDFPFTVSNLFDLAAHEAYPGHHTVNVVRDAVLARRRGLVEYSFDPSIGPEALFREGLAQNAADLAFPDEERARFEAEVLAPLAGIVLDDAERRRRVEELLAPLELLAVEGARAYLDGKRDRVASAIWLEGEALVPDPWAFLRFVDRYRTYVVAYPLGEDVARRELERDPSNPWRAFTALVPLPDDAT